MTGSLRIPLLALALLTRAAVCGCGNEEGIPHPDPLPDVTRLRASALMSFPEDQTGEVTLLGLPGCVAGAGQIIVESLGKTYTARSTASGTFALTLTGQANGRIAVRFESSAAVYKTIVGEGAGGPIPPGAVSGTPPLTDLGNGAYRVQGGSSAPVGNGIICVNTRSGEIALGTVGTGNLFQVDIAAVSGDSLKVYDDEDPLGATWTLTVP